jgi:hypothetical protein
MAYISSKYAKSASPVTANSTSWETICETPVIAMVPGTNTRARIHSGWRATAGVLPGEVRVVIHDGSQDIELAVYDAPLGASSRTSCDEHAPAVLPSASHVAKLQCRAGSALSSVAVDTGDAWVEMLYLTS